MFLYATVSTQCWLLALAALSCLAATQISHLQFKVLTRIVLQLVDPIPCIGGATVTLLKMPYLDMQLRLFKGPDLMSFPGVKQLMHAAVEVSWTESAATPCITSAGCSPGVPTTVIGLSGGGT